MHKFNYFCSIVLAVTLPLMIFILSSNLVLRVSATYTFHFNDSQVIGEVPYNITGSETAGEIASYWSSFSSEPFQVYEKNGNYRDPVFEEDEQQVMGKIKSVLNIELAAGFLCLIITLAIYIYLYRNGFRDALRKRSYTGMGIAAALLVIHAVCWCTGSYRRWLYDTLIGMPLAEDSTLVILLGDPFFKTYVIFASILGAALLGIVCYINYHLTRPNRIFY